MSANLPGSGTIEDPYLISSYEDFKKMDDSIDALENPKEYKLTQNINMIGRKWTGVNLCNGRLNLSDRIIYAPDVEKGSFMFSDGVVHADLEVYDSSGMITTPAKSGYILNINGDAPETLFKNIDFERIGITIPSLTTVNIPFQTVTTNLCNIYVNAKRNTTNTLFRGKQIRKDAISPIETPFVDTRFVINGTINPNKVGSGSVILFTLNGMDSSTYTNDVILNRCLIEGVIDATNAVSAAGTGYKLHLTKHAANGCVFAVSGPSHASITSKCCRLGDLGASLSVGYSGTASTDMGMNIQGFTSNSLMTNPGAEFNISNMLIPSKLQKAGFNVIEINPDQG